MFSLILSVGFVFLIARLCFLGAFPYFILAIFIVMSLVAFFTYMKDKCAAQSNKWRVPESTLHLIALIGGWPGALIAQGYLRHKSAKASFLFVYWITVLMNCGFVGWLLTPDGAKRLNSITQGEST